MPEISRFFGIIIKMFFDDHNPPHFHEEYSGEFMLIDIRTLSVFAGRFSPRALGLVIEWATLRQQELFDNWERARARRNCNGSRPWNSSIQYCYGGDYRSKYRPGLVLQI